MRIVIDMQGAQAENKNRGIGRYSLSIVKSIVKNSKEHEIILVLNASFKDTVESIRYEFKDILSQGNIRVWRTEHKNNYLIPEDIARSKIPEATFEAFILAQLPDFILITSLFEGLVDDAVTSVKMTYSSVPVSVILYDLIPYINPSPYLDNPNVNSWYLDKVEQLKKADLFLAISESSKQEGINYLGLDNVYCISTDADGVFKKLNISKEEECRVRESYRLNKPFVMYTGGIDHRKNVEALIRSFAMLPADLKESYQLAIVCSIQPDTRRRLELLSKELGLKNNELVLTDFVPEDNLVTLYNICRLFVFPSWHEGFGLPALEAMRCGAPVIGANSSSLPEVIGCQDALFNPKSDEEMSRFIEKGLIDESYRHKLLTFQQHHATKFSWDESARTAISAMEEWHSKNKEQVKSRVKTSGKLKLAYLSPLPPAKSGIADYSAELLPSLSQYYDIDLIVEQEDPVNLSLLSAGLKIKTVENFLDSHNTYDRVVYNFGNSSFHSHMFHLLETIPGIVILHDFFLSGIQAHREVHELHKAVWAKELLKSHGYMACYERYSVTDTADVVWKYPVNLSVLERAKALIVHSKHSVELAMKWYGQSLAKSFDIIPLLRAAPQKKDRNLIRKRLGFKKDDLIVCSFGGLGKSKLNHCLIDAWLESPLALNKNCYLIYVGSDDNGEYCESIKYKIKNSTLNKNIKITGWIDDNGYKEFLIAADIGVQLRSLSRGETSAAVLDCMNYGLPTIVNAHGSMADIEPSNVLMIPDKFSNQDLINALSTLAFDSNKRSHLSRHAVDTIRINHLPEQCANKYFKVIEDSYSEKKVSVEKLIEITSKENLSQNELISFIKSSAQNFPPRIRKQQLLVDISELVQRDAKSGIQRVVRAILLQWLMNPPVGYRVEPVYAQANKQGYRYARQFTCKFMGIPDIGLQDEPVDAWQGDVFIGLDLQPVVVPIQKSVLQQWRNNGVSVWFVVYDLLPLFLSHCFPPGADVSHTQWLRTIAEYDGVACISESVAEEFRSWISKDSSIKRLRPINIRWFHLGADMSDSHPTLGFNEDSGNFLNKLTQAPSFLMVGTIEPRKGHEQVLNAFEHLWANGNDFILVIVGQQGWMVENLVERLRNHVEAGKKLYWLEGISDEYLEKVYQASSCLIAASYGEGFGLPLIEAAQHKIPIIARDIPVFREVAGDHAFYYHSNEPGGLATAIQDWLELYQQGRHPSSDNMPWLTWKESSEQLKNVLFNAKWHKTYCIKFDKGYS